MDNKDEAVRRIKKLEEHIAKKQALLIRVKGSLSVKERKARVRRLIEIGSLAEIAELTDSPPGFLLGCLLEAKEISPESAKWRGLKARGDAILKEREAARKKKLKAKNG